jgi:hypothetical protein
VSYAGHISFNLLFSTIDVWRYNWLARFLAWHPEKGHLTDHSFVLAMICSYPLVVSPVLLLIIIPYAWLLFRANIDLDTCDLLHWNRALVEKKGGDPDKLLKACKKSFWQWVSSLFITFGLPDFWLQNMPSLEQSRFLYVVMLAFYTWFYAVSMTSIVLCYATYQQLRAKRGPFFTSKTITS